MKKNRIISLLMAVAIMSLCILPMGAAYAAPTGNTIAAVFPDTSEPTKVTVSGTSVQYPGTVVTIMVWLPLVNESDISAANIGTQAAFIDEVALDSGSAFTTTFNISGLRGAEAPSGRYTVKAFIPGLTAPLAATFDYKDTTKANAVVTAVRTATDYSTIYTALASGISAVDVAAGVSWYAYPKDSQRTEVAKHIFDKLGGNASATESQIQDELTLITGALDAICDLADDTRDDLKTHMESYMQVAFKNLMGFTDADIATYNGLTTDQKDKAVVYLYGKRGELVLPSDLTRVFAAALTDAQTPGTDTNYTPTTPSAPSGFGVGSSAMPSVSAGTNSAEGPDAFTDLGSVAWAKNAINILSDKGVISGRGEGEFAPNDLILREEMLKLLIEGFNIASATGKALPFGDVSPTAWYYEYVVRAYTQSITSGVSEKEFGVGSAITRQDMAVFLANALNCAGFVPEQTVEEMTFSDDAQLADYAREAVYTLAKAGVINGMGDGSFAPEKTATRAEVAVLLYRAMYKFNLI